ncbi:hypothetical protein [Amycolatopsis sp. CA-128772]|nr:hypothetical protein [Amycolatopsis sp. CA-128772]
MAHVSDHMVHDETQARFGGIGDSGGDSRSGATVSLENCTGIR